MARKLLESQFRSAAYATTRWNVVPADNTPFEDLLARDYWTNVARKMTPGDIIEVHAPDGSYFAELLVRATSRIEATVVVLRQVDFAEKAELTPDAEYEIKYRNPASRYGVIRLSDNHLMKANFQTAAEAAAWLKDHRRSMAA